MVARQGGFRTWYHEAPGHVYHRRHRDWLRRAGHRHLFRRNLGNDVTCVDVDRDKIAALRQGRLPFFEPSLLELLERNVAAGRLRFAGELGPAIESAEVIFIAVGTPMDSDGRADLQFVESAARQIGAHLNGPKTVVYKSTVPVRTGELIATIISEYNTGAHEAYVVSNPEFLREGSAVADFMQPDRVVVGTEDPKARQIMQALYAPLDAPILFVYVRTAEMIKYTANAFLAMKVSFINEIANICELVGADVKSVGQGIGYDKRIGTLFMNPGIGYGGSCLPKDVSALAHVAAQRDYEATMLQAVMRVNRRQLLWSVNNLKPRSAGCAAKRSRCSGSRSSRTPTTRASHPR